MPRFSQALTALSFALALALGACSGQKNNGTKSVANLPEEEIRDLSYAIKAADTYREDKRHLLDSIEDSLTNAPTALRRFELCMRLSFLFRPSDTDSSLFYANRAIAIAEKLGIPQRQIAEIALTDALSTAGIFTAATDLFNELGRQAMDPDVKLKYWLAGRRLYGYMKSYTQGNQMCYNRYDRLYQQYDDSLLMYLPKDDMLRSFLECERMVYEQRYSDACEQLGELMGRLEPGDNLYGMAAFQMAEVYRNLGDEERYAAMLATSALSDVKGCISEGLALPTLADWLYRQGELNHAFSFINFALEEATSSQARMRAVTIARFVPLIDEAYQDKINSSRDELMVYFILVTLLLIIAGVLTMFLFKQMRKSKEKSLQLAQTSRRQESYIGNFIGLYSSYADRLNHLAKLVSAKLASGQSAELKKLMDSGKFTDQNNDDIHKIFDSAFLDIYPDFVARINSLLRPEEKIEVKGEESLTPELRIYAFVKLGIEESTRIAQILHYSVHTVYTYRNKMRNKAIHRDSFDSDVKNL